MSKFAQHRFGVYGPVCGTHDGINAADMDPPEITCRRCPKAPVNYWDTWQLRRHDGKVFVTTEKPKDGRWCVEGPPA